MRSILGSSLASLAVIYVLFVLLSGHRNIPSDSRLINNSERISNVGDRLIQVIVLRHQRQSKDYLANPNTDRIMKVQQALKNDSFHSGSVVDGTVRQSTRETIRSFQESNLLNVTGTIDDHTTQSSDFILKPMVNSKASPRRQRAGSISRSVHCQYSQEEGYQRLTKPSSTLKLVEKRRNRLWKGTRKAAYWEKPCTSDGG